MSYNFQGKVALVTGATKGIGKEIAIELSKSTAKVIAVARSKQLLDDLQKEHPSIKTVVLDISDWDKTRQVLSTVGPIDLLVNNAGMGWLKPFLKMEEQDFDSVFGVNAKALMNVTQIAIKDMMTRKVPGSIVNLSSQASLVGLLDHSVYCASKGAVDSFTRAAALEFGPHKIRVNAVNPTVIMTDMGKLGWSDPKVSGPMLEKIPLRRFGEISEVVNTVLFLLSDQSSMITGVTLPIDGGYTAA
ncbi:L-xylulose reductase-like [Anthonomus grandis grandis]|uniref:L-xylulose reductase-like n=1 Tax=Anthonomus grandis grandis TaxID=2921223 RepID=UPI0021651B60|nr:L-xylulose reductase-like [Anthonomus grandis grandis]